MRLVATPLAGAFVVELELLGDERGWFARTYDAALFEQAGLEPVGVQCNSSFNAARDTLRGLHFQADPHGEAKLVRCMRGAIWDVGVDLRPSSPTLLRVAWRRADRREPPRATTCPRASRTAFRRSTEDCEVQYLMGHVHVPESARGVRWDDPAFAIDWPAAARRAHDVRARRRLRGLRAVSGARRVLVTGASGFVGRRVLEPLRARGFEVHAVGRRVPAGAGGEVVWHAADLLDAATRRAVVAEVGASHLLHLAWYAEPGAFWAARENAPWVAATVALVDEFATAGGTRATLAGTCAEYDWSAPQPLREDAPIAAETYYGTCKDATRRVVEGLAAIAGLSLSWGRIFFLYGPREDERRLVASVARALVAGERAPTSSGTQRRDFLHVDDVAGAFAALLDSEVCGAVNIASGLAVEVRGIVESLARAAGRPDLLDVGALASRPGDPAELVADVTRLRDEVGFAPVIGLDEGLAATIAWWRDR